MALRVVMVSLFLCFALSAQAQQYVELLDLSEEQLKAKVTNFHSVTRDSSEHEFVTFLTYRNEKEEVEAVFYFFVGRCYMVRHFVEKDSLAEAIKSADARYNKIGDHFWRDKRKVFEVRIESVADKGLITYTRGSSDW